METYIVDAFTNKAFKGNPAGVCIVTGFISEEKMQSIASELNLSETAFIQHISNNEYSIRYFSPIMEIPLCGHATLASAKVIFEKTAIEEIEFVTFEKLQLVVQKTKDAISMEFPIYGIEETPVNPMMLKALGIAEINFCGFNKENDILVLQIESTTTLANLSPNFSELIHTHSSISGVAVTAKDTSGHFDFQSRFFWPWSGSNEDPVTGVIHTFLTPYWGEILGKTKMTALQASKRTGILNLELTKNNTLILKGEAVIVFEGKLCI